MKFVDQYDQLINRCRGRIPREQLYDLENTPKINPMPKTREGGHSIKVFDWYVRLQLIRGQTYGPFYRADKDFFWPQIDNFYDDLSWERNCFWGLEKSNDKYDDERLYKIRPTTEKKYIYELFIEMPKWPVMDDAYVLIGPVKNGHGFQINPSSTVVELIREKILKSEMKRYSNSGATGYVYQNKIYMINKE